MNTKPAGRSYDHRLLSFVDLCGFKQMVCDTTCGDRLVDDVYQLMQDVTSQKISETVYGGIETLGLDGTMDPKLAGDLEDKHREQCFARSQKKWPLVVTHFSDSFVISGPADNIGSTRLHLQLLRAVVLGFLKEGITIRGGLTAGQAIHENHGVLFGPAMIRAYGLESKLAHWPRILVDSDAANAIKQAVDDDDPLGQVLQPCDSGFMQLTPASCYAIGSDHSDQNTCREILERLAELQQNDQTLVERYEKLLANWDETISTKVKR